MCAKDKMVSLSENYIMSYSRVQVQEFSCVPVKLGILFWKHSLVIRNSIDIPTAINKSKVKNLFNLLTFQINNHCDFGISSNIVYPLGMTLGQLLTQFVDENTQHSEFKVSRKCGPAIKIFSSLNNERQECPRSIRP